MSSNDAPDISPSYPYSAPLGDPILRNIGLIAVMWSAIEAQLELAILGIQEINFASGMVVSSELGYRAKINLLRTIANEGGVKPGSEAKKLLALLKRMDRAYPKRNHYVHSVWSSTDDPDTGRVRTVRAKGKLRVIDEPVSVDRLAEVAEEIRQIGEDMSAFMIRNSLTP